MYHRVHPVMLRRTGRVIVDTYAKCCSTPISHHPQGVDKATQRTRLRSFSLGRSSSSWSSVSSCVCLPSDLLDTGHRRSILTGGRSFLHTSSVLNADAIDVEGPAFADSISEGDIRWIKQVGDFVTEDEIVAEIETDKTSMEVPAPQAGTIESLLVADGEKVTAKQKLYRLVPGGSAGAAAPAAAPKAEALAASPPPPATPAPPVQAAPAAGAIPTSQPPVSAPKTTPIKSSTPPAMFGSLPGGAGGGGAPAAGGGSPPQGGIALAVPKGVSADKAVTGARAETRVKMNRMRLRIAQRLKDAQNTYAMLTTFQEIDMSNVIEMRKLFGAAFQKRHGVKLGFMSPFIRASAHALIDQPVVNAVIDEGEMVYRHFIDISVAVATPKGLVVPVLRNVEAMNYAQIEQELAALGEKARDNRIAIEDMEGGTFTISNGGVFGSLFGTPIINPPQAAILGMHATFDKPAAVNGKVEVRPIMVAALTYDHRLVDGREAVTFLKSIKASIEDPRAMLLDL